jgi:hypothetical protein
MFVRFVLRWVQRQHGQPFSQCGLADKDQERSRSVWSEKVVI